MLFILVSTLFFTLVLMGFGRLVGLALHFDKQENPWIWFWFGFFCLSVLGIGLSMFMPLTSTTLFCVAFISFIGLPKIWREVHSFYACNKTVYTQMVLLLAVNVACAAYIIAVPFWNEMAYDTDLYHAQVIRWLNEYGTPQGLANVHVRFGNNSAWHLVAALFDNNIWNDRIAWIMPILAFNGGFGYFFHVLFCSQKSWTRLYSLCIIVWINLHVIRGFPNLYFDFPALLVNAILVMECLYLCLSTGQLAKTRLNIITTFSALVFMIKPIGAFSIVFSSIFILFNLYKANSLQIKSILHAWALPCLAGMFWVTRNSILSGYPLFPLPLFALPFDWTAPFGSVHGTYLAVLGWARLPGPNYLASLDMTFWQWFQPWIAMHTKTFFNTLVLFGPLAMGLLLWIVVLVFSKPKPYVWFFAVWSFGNILYWFNLAPDPRFGDGFIWVFLALSLAFTNNRYTLILQRYSIKLVSIALALALLIFLFLPKNGQLGKSLMFPRALFTISAMPSKPLRPYLIEEGAANSFILWVPKDIQDDRCGNAQLPCAPSPVDNLRLRKPGDMSKGFWYNKN